MKKLLIDESLCNACGMCIIGCELLTETTEGKAKVIPPGIVEESSIESVLAAVNICPVSALRIDDSEKDTMQNVLEELKGRMLQPLTFKMPDKNLYAYNSDDYRDKMPMMKTANEGKYQHKSYSVAEEKGLKEFRDQIYSQKTAMAQQIIIAYKHDKVYKFMKYEEVDGNYKYDFHQKLIEQLKGYVKELEILTARSLTLPNDFFGFKIKNSDTFKLVDKYGMDQGMASAVAAEIDGYSSYSCYIDSDEKDLATRSIACFKTTEAVRELQNDLLREAKYVLEAQIGPNIEAELKTFYEKTDEEWREKIQYLLNLM